MAAADVVGSTVLVVGVVVIAVLGTGNVKVYVVAGCEVENAGDGSADMSLAPIDAEAAAPVGVPSDPGTVMSCSGLKPEWLLRAMSSSAVST